MPVVLILAPAKVFSASLTASQTGRRGIRHVVRRFDEKTAWRNGQSFRRVEAHTLCGKWIPFRWSTDQYPIEDCQLCTRATMLYAKAMLVSCFVMPPIPIGWYITHVGRPPICDGTGDARELRAGTSPPIRPA